MSRSALHLLGRWGRCCGLAAILLLAPSLQAEPVPEYDLKAAFVYNFALFTDWPSDTTFERGTLNICVNPYSPVRHSLEEFQGKQVKGRRVAVHQLVTLEDLRTCHVLFVDVSDRGRWDRIKKGLATASVLTIADDQETAHDGIVISLAMSGNRIVFDVDTRAARNAHLVLSSKLLRLARTVQ